MLANEKSLSSTIHHGSNEQKLLVVQSEQVACRAAAASTCGASPRRAGPRVYMYAISFIACSTFCHEIIMKREF